VLAQILTDASFALTVAAGASPLAEGFSSAAAEAESVGVVVAFVESEGDGASEDLGSVVAVAVAGPEGCSPLAAEVLVADAVSSMGAGRPIDCASFTTSLVTCSAITVCATATGEELLSERCSCTVRVTEAEGEMAVVDADADSSASCPDLRSCSM
jgi:hypothetical protein